MNILATIRKWKNTLVRFFKFQLVAVAGYWSEFGIFALLLYASDMSEIACKICSYPVGLMFTYLFNKSWTFCIRGHVFSKYLLKFFFVTGLALAANLLAMTVLIRYYEVDAFLAQMAATLFSFIINFAGSTVWVFNKEK